MVRYGQFQGAFLHCTNKGGFPPSQIAPHLWRSGNWSTKGIVHHISLTQLVWLKKLKNQITSKSYIYKKKKHINNNSLKPTQNISNSSPSLQKAQQGELRDGNFSPPYPLHSAIVFSTLQRWWGTRDGARFFTHSQGLCLG